MLHALRALVRLEAWPLGPAKGQRLGQADGQQEVKAELSFYTAYSLK